MEKKDVLAPLNGIFSEALKTPDLKLDEAMSAKDVDGWDSISNMIIISEIEKHYGIHFKFRDIMRIKNVGGLCDAIIDKAE